MVADPWSLVFRGLANNWSSTPCGSSIDMNVQTTNLIITHPENFVHRGKMWISTTQIYSYNRLELNNGNVQNTLLKENIIASNIQKYSI